MIVIILSLLIIVYDFMYIFVGFNKVGAYKPVHRQLYVHYVHHTTSGSSPKVPLSSAYQAHSIMTQAKKVKAFHI